MDRYYRHHYNHHQPGVKGGVGDHVTALRNANLGLLRATNAAEKDVAGKLIADLNNGKGNNY